MAEKQAVNYPDVFGYITDAERVNVGVVQVALATRPRIVQAGRPFEVIMLIQNASDSAVDVTVTLRPPEKDSSGHKGRFITGKTRLVVGMEPAEVGYAMIPLSSMPDTAVGNDYTVGMDIGVKVLEKKANRVRQADGGGRFNPERISPDARQQLEDLRKLTFSTQKRGGLLRGATGLQTPFSILAGKIGKPLNLTPGWVSLWTLDNQSDIEPLIEKYGELLRLKVLPVLKRQRLYPLLLAKTTETFKKAGYPLTDLEATIVARLLTLILEFAQSGDLVAQGGHAAGAYFVQSILTTKLLPGEERERHLPHWTMAFLQALAKDDRIARVPAKAIVHFAYKELVHDAIIYGLQMVERDTGESLGAVEEMEDYAQLVLKNLHTRDHMSFSYAYLPLVLAGVIVIDLVMMKDERLVDLLKEMRDLVENRRTEENEDTEAVFDMSRYILNLTLKKYGILDSGR